MLDLVRRGVPPTVAMTRIGRAKATISMREDRDSEFAARLAEAEAEAEILLLDCVLAWAPKDWRAAAWRLARQFPERWGDDPEIEADEDSAAERAAADRAAWEQAVGTVPGFGVPVAEPAAPAAPPPTDPPPTAPAADPS